MSGQFVNAINGNACINFSDYQKYGCPYCGYDLGHTSISGGGSSSGRCGKCNVWYTVVADGLTRSPVGYGSGNGPAEYPEVQPHPRRDLPVENWPRRRYEEASETLIRCGFTEIEPGPQAPVGVLHCAGERITVSGKRRNYYFVAEGWVPANIAERLYADPVGREVVRVDGHCGCPAPRGPVGIYHIDSEDGLALFVRMLTVSQP